LIQYNTRKRERAEDGTSAKKEKEERLGSVQRMDGSAGFIGSVVVFDSEANRMDGRMTTTKTTMLREWRYERERFAVVIEQVSYTPFGEKKQGRLIKVEILQPRSNAQNAVWVQYVVPEIGDAIEMVGERFGEGEVMKLEAALQEAERKQQEQQQHNQSQKRAVIMQDEESKVSEEKSNPLPGAEAGDGTLEGVRADGAVGGGVESPEGKAGAKEGEAPDRTIEEVEKDVKEKAAEEEAVPVKLGQYFNDGELVAVNAKELFEYFRKEIPVKGQAAKAAWIRITGKEAI
jgi:hypothetical protein